MKIKGILFDKDGTLIDFYEVWLTATYPVVSRMMEIYGIPATKEHEEAIMESLGIRNQKIDAKGALAYKSYPEIAEDLLSLLERLSKQSIDVKELTMFLIAGYGKEVAEKRESYPVFTELPVLFHTLREKGIEIGLATTDEKPSTEICMEKLGVSSYISFWGTAGTGYPIKPSKRLLEEAAKQWNIRAEEIAVVGDTPNDMLFAQNAGAIGVAVLSGTGEKEELSGMADYVIRSVDELLTVIE